MTNNLVWTFWLALVLAIIGTLISTAIFVNQWKNYVYYSQIEDHQNFPLLTSISEDIIDALNNEGNVEKIIYNNPIDKIVEIFIIDSSGNDLLNRTLPGEFNANPTEQSFNTQRKFTQKIKLDNGDIFNLVFIFDWSERPLWNLFKTFGLYWGIFAGFLVSGLISWWLAVKTVRPIQDIATASEVKDNKNFFTGIDKKILKRPDQIGSLARTLLKQGMKIENLVNKQKDILRDVSHEVRTPLARMQIAVETLELDATDKDALNQIKDEVTIIDQLVQDLLNLSYFDSPSKPHKIENISVSQLISKCLDRSQIQAELKNISIIIENESSEDINIMGIKFLIDRALDNVMNNAIRHAPEFSKIEFKCSINNNCCSLSIKDKGEGVNEESLQKIFEPFFREDPSRNRQTGGFGLGLSLVKRIVKLHEGNVYASNQPDGFVVTIELPIS